LVIFGDFENNRNRTILDFESQNESKVIVESHRERIFPIFGSTLQPQPAERT